MSGERPVLRAVEETPDTKLPDRRRDALKALVRYVEEGSDQHELMYLAGAFEDAARRKAGRS
ncbi:hypothetical protein GBA65_15080 [Rubrobacter marinus]|uniref:Uncharacterized protein n=1 Tax=Rubrobacter marinus TaxID=2653852 RepID=A0A6G8PZN0_9ACTN|nr:hypothetical protein [Rubrobacter marinus]QIN79628.1 hypothetical protein GBA65_15080 [Rubrobacter marinus]